MEEKINKQALRDARLEEAEDGRRRKRDGEELLASAPRIVDAISRAADMTIKGEMDAKTSAAFAELAKLALAAVSAAAKRDENGGCAITLTIREDDEEISDYKPK